MTSFDIDIYLLEHFARQLRWILDFKAFVIMAVVAVSWLALGTASFVKTALYVGGYPGVVVFWILPKIAFKRWPVVILSAPVIYRLAPTFRTTFLLYTLAALSGSAVLLSADRSILGTAVAALIVFVFVHLFRSFRKAYGKGAFVRLSVLLSKLRASVADGKFDGTQPQAAGNVGTSNPAASQQTLPTLYLRRTSTPPPGFSKAG